MPFRRQSWSYEWRQKQWLIINPSIQFNPDDSDSEKPDTAQVELVKKLHREMADRRIIVNMKTKLKLKKECVQKRTFKKSKF